MYRILKNPSTLLFLLVVSAAIITPSAARAWDSDEDDDWAAFDSDEKIEASFDSIPQETVQQPRVLQPVKEEDDEDHSHHIHIHTAGVLTPNLTQQEPKQFGSPDATYALHNESCSPTGKSCSTNDHLKCSSTDGTGRCLCVDDYVHVNETNTCWIVPKSEHDPCAHDVQCHAGKWGRVSRCGKQPARCECYDYRSFGKQETIRVDGVCFIKKTIGGGCNLDSECYGPISGDAYCQLGNHSFVGGIFNGTCQCREGSMWYKPMDSCLRIATKLNDPCKIDEQCQDGPLGRLSTCHHDSASCRCWHWNNATETVYFDNECFVKKAYNDTCKTERECRASLGPDVECGIVDNGEQGQTADKVCHCPKGKVCRSSAFSPLLATTSSWVYAIAAVVTLMSTSGVRMGVTERK